MQELREALIVKGDLICNRTICITGAGKLLCTGDIQLQQDTASEKIVHITDVLIVDGNVSVINIYTDGEGKVVSRMGLKDILLELGWVGKGDVLVQYGTPRLGWKPADGTLIIGYHEWPEKVLTIGQLNEALLSYEND